MNRLLKDRNVPKKDKQIIHQTIVRHILIFEWMLDFDKKATTADYNSRHVVRDLRA